MSVKILLAVMTMNIQFDLDEKKMLLCAYLPL